MPNEKWFDALRMSNQHDHYSWLAELPQPQDRIANFGCWSGCEPFAILWILNAHEITVVEIEEKSIAELNEQKETLSNLHPSELWVTISAARGGGQGRPGTEVPKKQMKGTEVP
jgi:hypothetical protein